MEVLVRDLANNGCGIANDPDSGKVLFIPASVLGDRLSVRITAEKKNYAEAEILEILQPSEDRISPDCGCYTQCGGCCFRHLRYERELSAKEGFVRSAFTRSGFSDAEFRPIIGSPVVDGYRNKVEFAVRENGIGFNRPGTHEVVDCAGCRLVPPEFIEIKQAFNDFMKEEGIPAYDPETGKGLIRHLILRKSHSDGTVLLCIVINGKELPRADVLCHMLRDRFSQIISIQLNENTSADGPVTGEKARILNGTAGIRDRILSVPVTIGPLSFFQVNTPAAELLYETAAEFADIRSGDTILDLYCGMGTIGLSMAKRAKKLIGCEIIDEAVRSAERNAAAMGIRNAEFFKGDAGKCAEKLIKRGLKPNLIILDPPRKGCDRKTLDAVLKLAPERIVSVSCDPSTGARDAAYLCANGYAIGPIQPVDLFPRTAHVETCVLLTHPFMSKS